MGKDYSLYKVKTIRVVVSTVKDGWSTGQVIVLESVPGAQVWFISNGYEHLAVMCKEILLVGNVSTRNILKVGCTTLIILLFTYALSVASLRCPTVACHLIMPSLWCR
uniref:Predicted protein n=1 Tax=Hordeum vulgare subsp. vulgare TaxID=112509 RepID=F2D161_HORVV|nr:predicted protein [Hordeum vulgare subsp. vulgare]